MVSTILTRMRGILFVAFFATTTVAATPPAQRAELPEAADITAYRSELRAVTDGAGHYVIYKSTDAYSGPMFYGDGKQMFEMRIFSGSAEGDIKFSATFWEPRLPYARSSFDFAEGKFSVSCHERVTNFTRVDSTQENELIANAQYYKTRWRRAAYALARDDSGSYFYVDKLREGPATDFRLYFGQRGRMKLQKMTNLVNDSAGDIFSTKAGDFRVVLDKHESKWVQRKHEKKLQLLPIESNVQLIYTELGVYDGLKLGTPCDDLM